MKHIAETLLLAGAFALPPRVVERNWNFEEREKMFTNAKKMDDWNVETIDPEPNSNSLMTLDRARDELSWVSPTGGNSHHISLRTRSRYSRVLKIDDRSWASFVKGQTTKQSVRRGSWELLKSQLFFIPSGGDGQPLWSLPVADDLVSIEVDKDRSTWMGLSTYPNRLLHMFWIPVGRHDEALMEVLNWEPNTELVSWVPCSEGRSLLLENKDGKMRLNFLRENEKLRTLDWEGYTEIKGSLATNMLARTCTEVYVSSMGGLLRASAGK